MQNAESAIGSSLPGTASFALTYRPEPRVDFLVREESSVIKNLATTKVTIRAKLFNKNNVIIILIMFQIGDNDIHIFDTFWNYHMEGGNGSLVFELMSKQEDIAFHLYGDSKIIEQSMLMGNVFKNFFKASIKKIENLPHWSVEQFEKEKEELCRTYPTTEDLWEAIK